MREKFAVLDAADYVDWLLEQVDVEFNLTNTRMAPLVRRRPDSGRNSV